MKYSMDNSSHTVELVDQIKEFLEGELSVFFLYIHVSGLIS